MLATCSLALAPQAHADLLDLLPPIASIDAAPNPATTGELVTFDGSDSIDIDGTITRYEWDLDGNGSFETDTGSQPFVTTQYFSAGEVTVGLRVSDTGEPIPHTDEAEVDVTIEDPPSLEPPSASFNVSPGSPDTGETITLTSTASDSDGTIVGEDWDLDDDGQFDDASGSVAATSFSTPGTKTLKLQVTDDDGLTDVATRTVTVSGQAPSASFNFTPSSPLTNQTVNFTSTSTDPDGSIAAQEWDLDNDGQYDDASGVTASRSFPTTGTKTVKLRVTDDHGLTNVATHTVSVGGQGPSASFDFSPSAPATNQSITFTSTSTDPDGSIASHAWDLDNDGQYDDGSSSTASRSFPTSGAKTVKLRVTDDDGFSNVATHVVTVNDQAPNASFNFTPAEPVADETVSFTSTSSDPDGSIVSQAWDLDNDGQYDDASGSATATSFADPGAKSVGLRVTDDAGVSDVEIQTLTVSGIAPSASFNVSPSAPLTNETITLTSTSSDSDGSIVSQAWDLDNDGDYDDANGAVVSTSFPTAGTRQVRLLVTDQDGLSTAAARSVTVTNRGPSASFNFAPASPQSGESVTLTSTSSDPDGSISSHDWDLDNDGEYDDESGATASTSFATPGTKTIKLRVIDNDGTSAIATRSITVGNRAPLASFTISPSAPISGQTVTFTSTSGDPDGSISAYAWDLDNDGAFDDSTSSNATRSFPTAGAKTVRLRVTDNSGGTAIATDVVNVGNRAPSADFTYAPSTFQTLQEVTFTSTSTDPDGSIASYQWSFGDGGTSTAQNPKHTFGAPGSYAITLVVTDNNGATDTVQQTVSTGNRAPTAAYSTSPGSPLTLQPVTFTSTSSDPDGTIVAAEWDFDDNGVYDATGTSVARSFSVPGTYRVTLRVTDNSSATNVLAKDVVVGNQAPTVSAVTTTPVAPSTLEQVTFSSNAADPERLLPLTITWDLDNDGTYDDGSGPTAARAFDTSGAYTVRVRVVDSLGIAATFTKSVTIANRPPEPSFSQAPGTPSPFETVTFTSTSGDPDGTVTAYEWDTDNDGSFDDGTAVKATRKFSEVGSFTVRLRVTDNKGATAIAAQTVFIGNRAPVASFGYSPVQPTAGQSVTLFSTSSDPDSPITNYGWDLDGNGIYSDASGTTAAHAFASPGTYNVGLLVTDSEGASSYAIQTITVSSPATAPPAARQGTTSRLMSPFPLVRIAGTVNRRGSRLRRLTVTAPPGSMVVVRCNGRSCPFARQSRAVLSGKKAKGRTPTVRAVRIRRFERRLLRSGTLIRVFVTKPGTIGKYTRFKIRARKAPARSDRCLAQGSVQPIDCPTS